MEVLRAYHQSLERSSTLTSLMYDLHTTQLKVKQLMVKVTCIIQEFESRNSEHHNEKQAFKKPIQECQLEINDVFVEVQQLLADASLQSDHDLDLQLLQADWLKLGQLCQDLERAFASYSPTNVSEIESVGSSVSEICRSQSCLASHQRKFVPKLSRVYRIFILTPYFHRNVSNQIYHNKMSTTPIKSGRKNGSPGRMRAVSDSPKSARGREPLEEAAVLTPNKRRRRELSDSVESLSSVSSSNESLQRFIDKSIEFNMSSPEKARFGEFERMVAGMSSPSALCPTPAASNQDLVRAAAQGGTPAALGDSFIDSPFTTHRKYGLWGSIETNYNFLMSDEVAETCKSTESDLSMSDEGDDSKVVTFTDFLQLYTELNEWISQSQAAVRRRSNGNVEKHLCQGFHQKLTNYRPKLKQFLSQGRGLTRRYPAMKEENGSRMERIQMMWRHLEEAVGPLRPELQLGVQQDVDKDLRGIRLWLFNIKNRISEVELSDRWTEEERQIKLVKHKVFLEEIGNTNLTLTSVKRLLEDPEAWGAGDLENKVRLESLTSEVEEELHTLWLYFLECGLQLEDPQRKTPRKAFDDSFESTSTQTEGCQSRGRGDSCDLSIGWDVEEESDYDTIPFASHEYEKIEEELKSVEAIQSMSKKHNRTGGDVGYSSGSASHEENDEAKTISGKMTPKWRHSLTSAYDTSSNNGSENNLHTTLELANHSPLPGEPANENPTGSANHNSGKMSLDEGEVMEIYRHRSVRKRLAFSEASTTSGSTLEAQLSAEEMETLRGAEGRALEQDAYRHATDCKHSISLLVKQADALVREAQLNELSRTEQCSFTEQAELNRSWSANGSSSGADSSNPPSTSPRRLSPRPISEEALFELTPPPLDPDQSVSESALHRIRPGSPISLRKLQHRAGGSEAGGLGGRWNDSSQRQRRRRRLGHSRSTDVGSRGSRLSESEEEPAARGGASSSEEEVHNKSAEFSDHAWDSYQAEQYSNLSDELSDEEVLDASHLQAEWEHDAPSIAHYALRSKPTQASRKGRREVSPTFPDSDSDLEDFHHVLTESQRALTFTEDTLLKRHNDPMQTGVNLDPSDYNESLATCKTQIQCLEDVVNTLRSEVQSNDVIQKGVTEVQELISRWRQLESVASMRLKQSQDLADLYKCMMTAQKQLEHMEDVVERGDYASVQALEASVRETQHFSGDMLTLERDIKVMDEHLLQLLNNSDDLDLLQYTQGLERLHEFLAAMGQHVPCRVLALHKSLLSWHRLLQMIDRCQQLMQAQVSNDDLAKVTQLLRNRDQLLGEVSLCCHDDQLAELRAALDDITAAQAELSKLHAVAQPRTTPALMPRRKASLLERLLRASLPLSALVFLLFGFLYLMKPDFFDSPPLAFTPELKYVNGPPPI